jgi:hypothetical protein
MKTTEAWAFTVFTERPFHFHTVEVFETRKEARELREEWLNQKIMEQGRFILTPIYKLNVATPVKKK